MGYDDVHDDRQRQPAQQDRHREQPNHPGDGRVRADMCVAHADFTRQKVSACTPSEDFSSLTSSSTVMRHPMVSLSPWATILALEAGAVRVKGVDPGRGAAFYFRGCGLGARELVGAHGAPGPEEHIA